MAVSSVSNVTGKKTLPETAEKYFLCHYLANLCIDIYLFILISYINILLDTLDTLTHPL